MYQRLIKRPMDFVLSCLALLLLLPFGAVLTVLAAVMMRGNPFFVQRRVGRHERVFRLIKLRTMTCERGPDGELLPDDVRLTRFGRALRASSLDELPELINIIRGELSIVGPRPLPEKYLPRYSAEQRCRHDIRPGLTGLAQVSGRNALGWDEKFRLDVQYAGRITFLGDIRILLRTVLMVIRRQGIMAENGAVTEEFFGGH